MSKLHDTLEKYISSQKGIPSELMPYALSKLEEEITKEIVHQRAAEIDAEVEKKRKRRQEQEARIKASKSIDTAFHAFWTVVVLGLLLGLLGNQVTDLISGAKGSSVGWTIGIIVLISIFIYLIYEIEFLSQAKQVIDDLLKKEQDDNNE